MFHKFTCSGALLATLLVFLVMPLAYSLPQPVSGSGQNKSLEFIQNRNQWDAAIKYRVMLSGGDLFLLQNRWVYTFYDLTDMPVHGHPHQENVNAKPEDKTRAHAYSVTFLGGNTNPELTTEGPTAGYRNYFIGNNPSHWASEVKAFEKVQYREIYKGITAEIYEHDQKLKYDFVVQPGADPKQIRMQYDGPENMMLVNGDLLIKTSVNTVTEQKPYAYQFINGKQKQVPCKFQLKNNVLSFVFPRGYRKKYPVIIDPTLIYSSYTGSTADNWGFTATYDNAGNIYSGGVVFYAAGGNFPVSMGAFQVQQRGASDIGIMKFDPSQSGAASRVWATYLGGAGVEAPHSLVVNSQNELLVLGTTSSTNFPTQNAYDNSFNGGTFVEPLGFQSSDFLQYVTGSDLFVSKFNASGNALAGSTFLGGSGNDGLLLVSSPLVKNYGDQFRGDITVDAADNVYIASSTASLNFPLVNAFQQTHAGGINDAVVCKLSPALNSLLWSSYLGGNGGDAAFSIQVDPLNNVYVCGGTSSNNLAQTGGAWKATNNMGVVPVDGFVSKITVNGNNPVLFRTSYVGTNIGQTGTFSGYDQAYFLQLDSFNNVYLFGQSAGSYPVVPPTPAPPTFFSTPTGHQFIQKLSTDLTTSIFSTRFGSANGLFNISPTAFLVDNCERIFICGWGGSSNSSLLNYVGGNTNGLPITQNAMQQSTDGDDFYLAQFSQDISQLEYATYFGGNQNGGFGGEHVDGGTSRFDKRGIVYHAVCAGCGNTSLFPSTPNAYSTINGNTLPGNASNCNNAAFKFDFAVTSAVAGGVQKICANAGPTQITGASPAGGVWSGTSVTPGGIFTPSQALIGTHVLTYTTTVGACVSFATKTVSVVPETPVTIGPMDSVYCIYDDSVALIATPSGGIWSGSGVQANNLWSAVAAGAGKHVLTYSFTDSVGCVSDATIVFRVAEPVAPDAGPDEGICATSDPFQLQGASPAGGVWSGNGVSASGIFTPSPSLVGTQTLTYSINLGACMFSDTKTIQVDPVPDVFASLEAGNCGTDSTATGFAPLQITFQNNTPIGKSFTWNFGDGTTSTEANPVHVYTRPGTYEVKLITDFGRGCVRESIVNRVTVIEEFIPNIITPNGDNLNDRFVPLVSCKPTHLKIFSRWGNVVYENENYNGEFKADNISSGTYYYFIQDLQGRKWKGWFEIVK